MMMLIYEGHDDVSFLKVMMMSILWRSFWCQFNIMQHLKFTADVILWTISYDNE